MNRSGFVVAGLTLILLVARSPALAQHSESQAGGSGATSALSPGDGLRAPIDEDIELLRKDVRAQSRLIVTAKMDLTDDEAKKFWPIYDQYSAEKAKSTTTWLR